MIDQTPLNITVPQTAALLGVSEPTIWRMLRRSEIRAIRIGRRTLVPRTEIEAYQARQMAAAGIASE